MKTKTNIICITAGAAGIISLTLVAVAVMKARCRRKMNCRICICDSRECACEESEQSRFGDDTCEESERKNSPNDACEEASQDAFCDGGDSL